MMDRYYYTVSQLPSLTFGRAPGISAKAFLEEAAKWLAPGDLRTLRTADIRRAAPARGDRGLIRNYLEFENELRTGLAAWRRARKEGIEVKPYGLPLPLLRDGDPLEVEKRLLEYRWAWLEERTAEHDFDLDHLILYFMKLQLLAWLAEFDQRRGQTRFEGLTTCYSAADLEPVAPSRDTGSEGTGE